jgi:hypothetical protein
VLALGLGIPAAAAGPEKPSAPKAPEDLTKSLVLATLDRSGDEQKTVKPRLVYRQGSWEPIREPVTGPAQWFPLSPKARVLQTETKPVQFQGGCETPFWALRVTGETGEKEELHTGLASSRKLELQPIQKAPGKLQAAVQEALKIQAPTELRLLKQQLQDRKTNDEVPSTEWTQVQRPPEERARCAPVTGPEWICYTRQQRELKATNGSAPVSHQCTSLFWLRGSDTAMRIIHASRECLIVTPVEEPMPMEEPPIIREPLGALRLEGHPYWLISTSQGPGGYELWEARAEGMRLLTTVRHEWGACD